MPRVRSAAFAALLLAVPAGLSAPAARAAPGDGFRYEGSLTYARGTYLFDRAVTGWTLSSGAAYQRERWSARIVVPVHLQSSVVANTGAGVLPSGGSLMGEVADRGRHGQGAPPVSARGRVTVPDSLADEKRIVLGDPVALLAVTPLTGRLASLTITAAVKAPLVSENDFGTGNWDAGGSAGVMLTPGPSWVIGADVSVWALGDLDSLDLRNPVTGTLTLSRSIRQNAALSLSATAGTSALRGYDGPVAASLVLTRFVRGGSVSAGLTVGFSETAADAVGSLSWGIPLGRR